MAIGKALSSAGLINVSGDTTATAQLIIVVGAVATDPRAPAEQLSAHVEMDVALRATASRPGAGRAEQRGRSKAPTC